MATGHQLWAERYDRLFTNIFVLQEEIRRKIVMHLALKLTDVEQERLAREYTSNPKAYDSLLRGWEYFYAENVEFWSPTVITRLGIASGKIEDRRS